MAKSLERFWSLKVEICKFKNLCCIIPHFSFCWSFSFLKYNRIIASLTLFLFSFAFRCSFSNTRLQSIRNKCYYRCVFNCLFTSYFPWFSSAKAPLLASEVIKIYYGKNLNRGQNPNNVPWGEIFQKGLFSKPGFCISTVMGVAGERREEAVLYSGLKPVELTVPRGSLGNMMDL